MKLVHQTLERMAEDGRRDTEDHTLESWNEGSRVASESLFGQSAIFGRSRPGWVPLAGGARNSAASSLPPLSTVSGTSKFVSVLRVTGVLVGGLELE